MRLERNLNLWGVCAVMGVVLCALGAGWVQAETGCPLDEAASETAVAAAEATATPGADGLAGMRVVIDPETGELRAPTAEEGARFFGVPEGQLPEKSEAQTPAIERPDGSLLLQFRGSFLKAAVATVEANGTVQVHHHGEKVAMPAHAVVNPSVDATNRTPEKAEED